MQFTLLSAVYALCNYRYDLNSREFFATCAGNTKLLNAINQLRPVPHAILKSFLGLKKPVFAMSQKFVTKTPVDNSVDNFYKNKSCNNLSKVLLSQSCKNVID